MPEYEFVTVDVFTDQRFAGNPLAVFPAAHGLTAAQMQALAREFNLSETTFVLPPDDPRHTARVRIFTPAHEIPFAGHPNVGTGYVLARRMTSVPEHFVFEEAAGLVRVHVLRGADGQANGARISAPVSLQIGIEVAREVVAACAGLESVDIDTTTHGPLVASVGTPFVIAQVVSLDALARARPVEAAFRDAIAASTALQNKLSLLLYVTRGGSAVHLRTRMFAPLSGVAEDPATGSAAATLAALLTSFAPGDNVELGFEIEQGVEMGRTSLLAASACKTGEGPVSASVSGACVPVMRGVVTV